MQLIACVVLAVVIPSPIVTSRTESVPKEHAAAIEAYKKAVYNAIGTRWYRLVERNNDLLPIGTVRLAFSIMPDGRVEKIRIVSNTSNEFHRFRLSFKKACPISAS